MAAVETNPSGGAPALTRLKLRMRRGLRRWRVDPHLKGHAKIGTLHKTGTVLWDSILKAMSREDGLRVWHVGDAPQSQPEKWDVLFDWHAGFAWRGDDPAPDAQALVTVRDPRDVLISAAKYHAKSAEAWLHKTGWTGLGRWADLKADTYHDAINALPAGPERILFEMDHVGGRVIGQMRALDTTDPRLMIVKLEDLTRDTELETFAGCFRHLGFSGPLLQRAVATAERFSIFSPNFSGSAHIRDPRAEQWRGVFDSALHAAFAERFGDVVEQHGYLPAE